MRVRPYRDIWLIALKYHLVVCKNTIVGDRLTAIPSALQMVPHLREAFPESCSYRYAIMDGDAKFGEEVTELLTTSRIKPTRISPASPWQNEVAERWIRSCRRELLDQLVVLNDVHLRRLTRDYIAYYHADRIHDSLEKDAPTMRPVSYRPDPSARVVSFQRIGGFHHRYDWQQAA